MTTTSFPRYRAHEPRELPSMHLRVGSWAADLEPATSPEPHPYVRRGVEALWQATGRMSSLVHALRRSRYEIEMAASALTRAFANLGVNVRRALAARSVRPSSHDRARRAPESASRLGRLPEATSQV